MFPRIEQIESKQLVGLKSTMTSASNKAETKKLWSEFMPRRKEVECPVNTSFISLQVYDDKIPNSEFSLTTNFTKWAYIEVSSAENIPKDMENLVLPSGKYAVFIHKGKPDTYYKTHSFIFDHWLPNSKYQLDNRPHFELLSENYSPIDINAEEEVWIPIKLS